MNRMQRVASFYNNNIDVHSRIYSNQALSKLIVKALLKHGEVMNSLVAKNAEGEVNENLLSADDLNNLKFAAKLYAQYLDDFTALGEVIDKDFKMLKKNRFKHVAARCLFTVLTHLRLVQRR